MSHIHILGIGGTFMAGLAVLARGAGHHVTGQDQALYPPMSDVLAAADIPVQQGSEPNADLLRADRVIIGNALSRGHPAVEAVLDRGIPYTSGPAWLAENVLRDRWVIAVAGTHGKTTTASLVAWLLEDAGLDPGFLIGGLPTNFGTSARPGSHPFFVIEADEYDTAFFDKRSKFVHFGPRTAVMTGLEFDHGDIFPDLAAIEQQFHYFVRTVPGNGSFIVNRDDPALARVLERGCWSDCTGFGRGDHAEWQLQAMPGTGAPAGWALNGNPLPSSLPGEHNARNAAAAVLAARHAGVPLAQALDSLRRFGGVRRRLEQRGEVRDIRVLDDFAHHPTAIAASLAAVRDAYPAGRILAVLEPRSNTMRAGLHGNQLAESLQAADQVFMLATPDLPWQPKEALASLAARLTLADRVDELAEAVVKFSRAGDTLLVMSNGDFGDIHQIILTRLEQGLPA